MGKEIEYCSTNWDLDNGFRKKVSFKDALFMGMAPDKGLFMPARIPEISKKEIISLKGKPYHEVVYQILKKFLQNDIADRELARIAKDACDFDIPIQKIDELTFIAWLDQGPTASFKDFAAQMMARLMHELKPKNGKIMILVATSGDTGSAIGEAYRGLNDVDVFILYPKDEVSSVQKKHMDSIGKNVRALAVDGKFDDCQMLVKEAFSDPDLRKLNLTSANSINVGRILPQIVYYFYIYVNLAHDFEPAVFSIPSGNFGNSFGCEIARRMGLPVKSIIIAVNENDEFPRFLESGHYEKIAPSRACLSNAMNIGNPSNLARYFGLYNGTLDKDGIVHKMPDIREMKKHLFSVSISDEETVKTMKEVYSKNRIIVEPHGAVGIAALEKYRKGNRKILSVCLETANPAKFPEVIEKELKIKPEIPTQMKAMDTRKGSAESISSNYEDFKKYLEDGR